jgi:YfiH family protein
VKPQVIYPDWPAPANVRALSTTRMGGCSEGSFASLNLGANSGDDSGLVAANRTSVVQMLPSQPAWLTQLHGNTVVEIDAVGDPQTADASVSRKPGRVCAVLTADCLPLLLCERHGCAVAAVHCGWRGLAAGIIENTVRELGCKPGHMIAWMGPAIGPENYEVGMDVFEAFTTDSADAGTAFTPGRPGHWQLDLYELVRLELARLGVGAVYGGDFCTYSDVDRFYSYRRDGETGRQASLVWLR